MKERILSKSYGLFLHWLAPLRPLIAVGVPTIATLGYFRHQQQQLKSLAPKIQAFHQETIDVLATSPALVLDNRLYMMGDAAPSLLSPHQALRMQITERGGQIRRYREELGEYWLSHQVERSQQYVRAWLMLPPSVGLLEQAHDELNSARAALELADELDSTLYGLKKRFYGIAMEHAKKALEILKTNSYLEQGIGQHAKKDLYVQAYNLAAKVARGQEQYKKSDEHYEEAKSHVPNNPIILGSQIALWGDMAWRTSDPDIRPLQRLLQDKAEFTRLHDCFKEQSIELANLSWVMLQAIEHASALQLSEQEQTWCLEQAYALADEALQVARSDSGVNPRLFRGIAAMQQAKQRPVLNEKQQFDAKNEGRKKEKERDALSDFEAGLEQDPYHPSLLRRRAMALESLNRPDEAYRAYQEAQIELSYRLTEDPDAPERARYRGWLKDIREKRLPALSDRVVPDPQQTDIIQHLLTGNYKEAYSTLTTLSSETLGVPYLQRWFATHFDEEAQKKGHFIPKAYDNFLRRLDLYATPKPAELIALSDATYQAKFRHPLGLPKGWYDEIAYSYEELPGATASGYLGVAFRHSGTGQIIISHGGTDPSNPGDLLSDMLLALGKSYPQLAYATDFTQRAIRKAATLKTEGAVFALPTVYHTGHSLGGALAAYVACTMTPVGSHYAVTFDNPSSYWQVENAYDSDFEKWSQAQLANFPVTSYLTRPSVINCAGGPHLGRVLRIQVPTQGLPKPAPVLTDLQKQTLQNRLEEAYPSRAKALFSGIQSSLARHDKTLIAQVFSHQPEEIYHALNEVHYALNWPRDLVQWLDFERTMPSEPSDGFSPMPSLAADYPLVSAYVSENVRQEGFKEAIPLQALGKPLSDLLKCLLTNKPLTEDQAKLSGYLHPYVLSCLQLDPAEQTLWLRGKLSSWELMTYLRQQVQVACDREKLSFGAVLYPDLALLSLEQLPPDAPNNQPKFAHPRVYPAPGETKSRAAFFSLPSVIPSHPLAMQPAKAKASVSLDPVPLPSHSLATRFSFLPPPSSAVSMLTADQPSDKITQADSTEATDQDSAQPVTDTTNNPSIGR